MRLETVGLRLELLAERLYFARVRLAQGLLVGLGELKARVLLLQELEVLLVDEHLLGFEASAQRLGLLDLLRAECLGLFSQLRAERHCLFGQLRAKRLELCVRFLLREFGLLFDALVLEDQAVVLVL